MLAQAGWCQGQEGWQEAGGSFLGEGGNGQGTACQAMPGLAVQRDVGDSNLCP